jgi:nuclease S1
MKTRRALPTSAALAALVLWCLPARAWGPAGHVIVARIAELNLTSEANAAIAELLPDNGLSDSQAISDSSLASFADHVRRNPRYPQYQYLNEAHFVDIAVTDPPFQGDPTTFCGNQKCVISAIEDFKKVLADKTQPKEKRQEALAFLVHFVGDLHQPLHCATRNDRGGNELTVTFMGHSVAHHPLELHGVWDSELVSAAMPSANALQSAKTFNGTITDAQKVDWKIGTTKDWAMESYKLACTVSYRRPDGTMLPITGRPDLDEAYVEQAKPVVVSQLKKAGIRLANVLNEALR